MSGYIGAQPVPQATQVREAFTATASQTSFATAGYTPGYLDVYLNGVKLAAADYTATNGSDVVLTVGATLSDVLETVAFTTFTSDSQTFTGTVTATAFVGDGSGLTNVVTSSATTGSAIMPTGTTAERDATPADGYLRFNSTDSSFEGYNGSEWGSIGGGATGGGSDAVFYENGQSVTTSYTVTATTNAMTAGPITINAGATVTVDTGGRWVVL